MPLGGAYLPKLGTAPLWDLAVFGVRSQATVFGWGEPGGANAKTANLVREDPQINW